MATVYAGKNESIDSLWKRFKQKVDRNGILKDLKKYEYYEKPGVAKKKKSAEAQKRARKKNKNSEKFASSAANFKFNKDKTVKIYYTQKPNQNQKPYQKNRS